jgi:general secretion pathway protein H
VGGLARRSESAGARHTGRHAGRRRKAAGGFTLIELLMVLALIAIIVTTVSVSIVRSLGGAEVRAAGRDLVAALRYTRGQAIVKREEQAFEFDVDELSYQAPGRPAVSLPDGFEMRVVTAAQEQTGDGKGAIRFFPDGSSGGGVIRLLRDRREWQVEIAWLTGEIRLREIDS